MGRERLGGGKDWGDVLNVSGRLYREMGRDGEGEAVRREKGRSDMENCQGTRESTVRQAFPTVLQER